MLAPDLTQVAGLACLALDDGVVSRLHLPRGPTLVVLAIHTVVLLFVGVNYGRQLTRVNREARLRLRAQSWHHEQIVDYRKQS